jgi:predicted amidophosphoribosyltransferase
MRRKNNQNAVLVATSPVLCSGCGADLPFGKCDDNAEWLTEPECKVCALAEAKNIQQTACVMAGMPVNPTLFA